MAKLRIKFGIAELECDGSKAFVKEFLKDFKTDLTKFAEGSRLAPENVALRNNALVSIEGMHSDLELLTTQHQAMVDLNERLSTAVRTLGEEAERYFRAVLASPALTGLQAGGEAGVDSASQLLSVTKAMQETQMSFNLQYLQLQSQMQHENRSYTAISNIMKTKHDTVKNSIGNIR